MSLASRATSQDGAIQPELRGENEGGYGDDSWRDMAVELRVCASRGARLSG